MTSTVFLRTRGRDLLWAVALALLTAGLGAWSLGMTQPGAWSRPLIYQDDPLEAMARLQAAVNDPTLPLRGYADLPHLGQPAGADWRAYGISDGPVFFAAGLLGRFIGLVPAWHVIVLAGLASAAVAFFATTRWLRWPPALAAALALLFALGTYNLRWADTLSLGFTFVVPPFLLWCGWLAKSGRPARSPRPWLWLGVLLALWQGAANPYYLYFLLPLVAGALVWHFRAGPHAERWRVAAVYGIVLMASFAWQHRGLLLTDDPSPFSRNYAGAEIYGLKLTDIVLPPEGHRWAAWGRLGGAYPAHSALDTEFFTNYLGFLALAGLAGLILATLWRLGGRAPRAPSGAAWAAGWLLALGLVGGLNTLVAYFGLDVFRAGNRVGPILFALGLLTVGEASRRFLRGRPWFISGGLAFALASFGLWDLLPAPQAGRAVAANTRLAEDRALAAFWEEHHDDTPTLFQLPATPFPEAGRAGEMPDYEHFRPWLTRPGWRLSYGAMRESAGDRWVRGVARLPPQHLVTILATHGFDTVWLDRRAYADAARAEVEAWQGAGAEFLPMPREDIAWLRLPQRPASPIAHADFAGLAEPWLDPGPTAAGLWLGAEGWYPYDVAAERDRGRWARAQSAIVVHQPTAAARTMRLSFHVAAMVRGELTLRHEDRVLWQETFDSVPVHVTALDLKLPPGVSRLHFDFTGRIRPPHTGGDTRQLGFLVTDVIFTPADQP